MSPVADDRKAEVLRLRYVEGHSSRQIAKALSMSRRSVRDILRGRKPSSVAMLPATAAPRRSSLLEPYEALIRAELDKAPQLRAPAMLERLRGAGYTGGITILRDRMRVLRPQPATKVFSKFQTRPGERLEVDWADLGFALPGVPRRVSAFVAVLVHSRMLYVDFTLSQQMGSFLRCMDRCIHFFGGRAAVDVFDNMKTVVIGRGGGKPQLHPRFVDFAAAHGFAVHAARPRTPTDKPFVERGIGFIRSRFLPGRRFEDLADLRRQGAIWRDTFANAREHEETGKVPALVFEHEERPALLPLRDDVRVDTDDIDSGGAGRTHRVHFDRNDYTVPWHLHGQPFVIRGNDETVTIWLATKEVARHPRCWSVGQDIAIPGHDRPWRADPQRSAADLPPALEHLGEVGVAYFRLLAASRRSIRAEQVRLVMLCELFGVASTASAIEEVMGTGHVGADYVEYVMRHKRRLVPAPPPLRLGDPQLDAMTVRPPDMAAYDAIGAARALRDPGEPPPPADEETTS